jgi:RNase H-fold protein (predicted Holliday junction resolvase)
MTEKVVLAIDPGKNKCGLALTIRTKPRTVELIWHAVVATDDLIEKVKEANTIRPFELIILGGGTTSNKALARLRESLPGMSVLVVDEANTTLYARERYWEYNTRKGWRRLIPATLQIPPEPVDDFAAMILAERVLMEP